SLNHRALAIIHSIKARFVHSKHIRYPKCDINLRNSAAALPYPRPQPKQISAILRYTEKQPCTDPTFRRGGAHQSMKKAIKPIIITVVVLGLAATVGTQVSRKLKKPPPPPKAVAAHLGEMVVKVSEAGTIEPVNQVDVRSKVAGRLLSMPIEEGQFV